MKTVCLALCEFNKDRKTLLLSHTHTGRFPKELLLKSHITGKEIQPDHPDYDEDGWDGEQAVYEPTTKTKNVEKLVIHCAY
jgi:hypothetical protein